MPIPLILWSNLQASVLKAQARHDWVQHVSMLLAGRAALVCQTNLCASAEADMSDVSHRAWTAAMRNSQQRGTAEAALHHSSHAHERLPCCLGIQAVLTCQADIPGHHYSTYLS